MLRVGALHSLRETCELLLCDKIPWPKQPAEEKVYLGLGFQKDKDKVHGDRGEVGQLELEAESLRSPPLKEKGICFS